jgi:probable HAF family extracellular repeat protein
VPQRRLKGEPALGSNRISDRKGVARGWTTGSPQVTDSAGQVVGDYTTASGSELAALWNTSGGTVTATALGTLGGSSSVATGINASGQIVGFSFVSGNATINAALWNGTNITDLGTLGGNYSVAHGINDAGQIVGTSTAANIPNAPGYATLWSGGKVINLNSEISPALALYTTLTYADAINDNGWIVASGTNIDTGVGDTYLLIPAGTSPLPLGAASVPLPASAWLMLSALGGLGFVARRRTHECKLR